MRADRVRCADVAPELARLVDGADRRADRPLLRHVERCLTCQAELATYRRLLRLLRQLRDQRPPVPAGVLDGLLADIEARAADHVMRSALTGKRVATAAAVAVAVTAASLTAGCAALRWRGHAVSVRRRRLPWAGLGPAEQHVA